MSGNKIFILGVGVSKLSFNDILEEVEKYFEKSKKQKAKSKNNKIEPLVIFTPNPEIIVYAQKDPEFRRIVNSGQINIPDGQGLVWASRILGQPLRQRIAGVDLLEALVKLAVKKGLTVGLIGGRPHVAVKALECLKKKYPGVKGWADSGNSICQSEDVYFQKLAEKIVDKKIDILFVGMGAPKQEYFMNKITNCPLVLMSVGGAFDYLAGAVSRAPLWLQKLGLEWFYRLIRQPWRLKRQLALAKFIFLAVRGWTSRGVKGN